MEIVIIVSLILFNGVLSMAEIALVSVKKSRLESEAKRGNRAAQCALKLIREPNRFLSAIQIGITLIGILTGLYSGEAFAADLAAVIDSYPDVAPYALPLSKAIIVIVVTYLTLVLGELVPKRVGMSLAERIAKLVARPMLWLSTLTAPFVWFLSQSTSLMLKVIGIKADAESKVTEEDIKAIVKEGVDDGEVQEGEHDMVERVFSLDTRDVGSIMTHRSDMVWLNVNDTAEETVEVIDRSIYSVYPVSEEVVEKVQGVAYLKELFGAIHRPGFKLTDWIRPANYLPENQSVLSVLEQFKRENINHGIVIDEFGDVVGMVTMRDILEALIGEIETGDDDERPVEREDGSWLFDGQYSFYSFLEQFDMEHLYAEHDFNTLSGLLLELFGHLPQTGETTRWHSLTFEVVDMDGARIDKILVQPPQKKDDNL